MFAVSHGCFLYAAQLIIQSLKNNFLYFAVKFQGHFVFSGCPIREGELPTQDCFDRNQLTFREDLLHSANYDPRHPERAYVAPYSLRLSGTDKYSYKMRLPSNLQGDIVLIQW